MCSAGGEGAGVCAAACEGSWLECWSKTVKVMKLRTVLAMAMGCLATLFSGTGKADGLESPAVKVGETAYASLEAAIAAAEPVDGVIQYEVSGKVEVTSTGWVQVLKSGLSDVTKVAFVGVTDDAEICIMGELAILADQQYDIDVSFKNLKLSKPNPKYGGDYGHSTNYFTTWLRNTGAAENTVTYENCTFPNGVCNNQYGKTVYTNCSFANTTSGLYNLWVYGGAVEMNGGTFTGTRGMKVYTEGTPATAPSVEVKDTTFDGLTEKAAIVVSKAATVALEGVSATDCTKGLIQKDIEGSTDDQKVTVSANGSKISGRFAITAEKSAESAKTEFNITGGTFTSEVSADYCADGFEVKSTTDADGNTTYGVVEAAAGVAKIGTKGYETLEAAFAAAEAGETITLLADVELTAVQTIDKAITLDLNGKTISSTVDEFITIESTGNLTINDATNKGRIENTSTSGKTIKVLTGASSGGILTVTGGSIVAHVANNAAVYSQSYGGTKMAINVKGGRIENDGVNSYAVKLGSDTGTINVSDGKMIGGQYGLYAFGYNFVNVYGGTIQGKTKHAVYASNNNTITISGGTLIPGGTVAALSIGGGSCTVTVGHEGGTVKDVTIPSIDVGSRVATVNLLSGKIEAFKNWASMKVDQVSQGADKLLVGTDISTKLPGSNLLCRKDEASGLYEIVALTVENASAVIRRDGEDVPYNTIEQAARAVADGETLTLKADYTGALAFTAKDVTIDLGGHTLTFSDWGGSALAFNQSEASDNTVTVKNGTIIAKGQGAACVSAKMTGDLSKTLTVVFGENLTLTTGTDSRYGAVLLNKGARTKSPCVWMTKGGLLVKEDDVEWIYGETETAFTHVNGAEVTLLNDWYCDDSEGAVKIPETAAYDAAKLNLDGHTVKYYGATAAIVMGENGNAEGMATKTLEISNGSLITSRYGAAVCGSNKTLTLDGVSLTTTGADELGIYTNGMTTDNTITLKNGSAVTAEKGTGIYFPGTGTLTVADSAVTGSVSGIEVRAGTLNVSGASVIKSTAEAFSFTNNDNGITTTGAAVAAVKHAVGNDLTVNISGGTFEGPCGFYEYDPNADKAGAVTIAISGGTFSTAIAAKYCAEGFIPTANEDGTYGVKEGAYVAAIGDAKYESLAATVAAANAGDTITLLADITLSSKQTIKKTLTLDLNGKTLSCTAAQTLSLGNGADVTIKDSSAARNGKITNGYAKTSLNPRTIYLDASALATLTVESGIIESNPNITSLQSVAIDTNNKKAGPYVINVNGGKVLVPEASTHGRAVVASTNVCLSITGGEVIGGLHGVDAYGGSTTTITGGSISARYVDTGVIKAAYGVRLTGAASVSIGATGSAANAVTVAGIKMDDNGAKVNVPSVTLNSGTIAGPVYSITRGTIVFEVTATAAESLQFADDTATKFLPSNLELQTEEIDGKVVYYVAVKPVAQIGDVKYETLQAAIDAAKSGATVQLIADTKENVTIAKMLTLDLNGFSLNGGTEKGKAALTVTARVTVKDSSEAQTGTIKREDTAENSGVSSHYVIDVQGNGWLIFEGGNVINNSGNADRSKGASLVRVGDDSVDKYPGLNIKGGTFTQDNYIVIKVDRGDLFVNGGTLTSANSYAIEDWHRTTINAGTVNGTVAAWTYSGGVNSSVLIKGGTINGNVCSVNYGNAENRVAKVAISGGTVTGTLETYTYENDLVPTKESAKATIEVTGGTFTNDPTTYVTEDAAATKNEDGTFGVARVYLAQVGENFYYTMDEAFHAAKAGETIVLLRNYTTDAVQNSGSTDLTFDLNGNTWTYTGTDVDCAAFEINYSAVTLTVKNGKVISNSMLGLIPSAMSGTITYDNSGLVFENVEATANGHSGIETNGGNTDDSVTLRNSTLNVPNGYGIYFPSSGTLTIENSTINAKTMGVQVCSGSLNISEGSAITVTGDAVPKTENDGAIEDGAAVSIVNRPGYKGLANVEISGGTFTAKSGNQALKAYTWQDKTESEFDNAEDTIAISGGTFSTAIDAKFCATGYIPSANADGTYGVQKLITDGTREHPYLRKQFAKMTRAEYIAAQERLGGTMYVDVGDYEYETAGVLGNGVRNDATGQIPDHSQINAYGENGYLGEKNDGANGKTVVFVGSSITSGATGYTSIDEIGTSLLLAVPAYTTVKFEGITFNNVFSFNYQLYTAPWSQLARIEFNDCTFNGIIVGAIAAQELAFTGCTFADYKNTTDANNSNPTWIRPAYGNWSKGDNTTQGSDFRSLTSITFENNKVTSTRPVKFERIAQWEMATTVTASGNTFDIKPQEGETNHKNVGMYLGANAKFDLVVGTNEKSDATGALFTTVYSAPDENTYNELPAGSTVKNLEGNEIEITDARVWKTETEAVLKTMPIVATVTATSADPAKSYKMAFSTFEQAYASATTAPKATSEAMITLAADAETTVAMAIAKGKSLTLSLNGCNLSVASIANAGTLAIDSKDEGLLKVADGISNTGSLTIENALVEASVTSSGNLTVTDADISSETGYGVTITGGTAVLDAMSSAGAGALDVQGGTVNVHSSYFESNGKAADKYPIKASAGTLTVVGETFVASDEDAAFLFCDGTATVSLVDGKFTGDIKVAEGATSPVITGGRYRKDLKDYVADGLTMKQDGDWYGVVIDAKYLTPAEGSRIVDSEGEADTIIASGVGLTAAVDAALTTDAAKDSYRGLFTISKEPTADGKWLVSCTMTATANALLTAQVDNPAMLQAIVNAVVKGGRATLTGATPGLYYSVVFGTEPTKIDQEVARFLATSDGTVVMPVPKPDDAADDTKTSTKGFYRLRVSVGPKAE